MDEDTFLLAMIGGVVRTIVMAVVIIWGLYILRPVLFAAVGV